MKEISNDTELIEQLHWAVKLGKVIEINRLLDKGANIDASYGEWSPLALAADCGYRDVVDALIERGAEVNNFDKDGYSPITWASQRGHQDIAHILQAHGAISRQDH